MSVDLHSPLGPLPQGWKLESLNSITVKIGSGSTPRGGDAAYLSERIEYAFVRSQNVFDFHFNLSEMKFISDEDAKKLKGVHLKKNDILLNITGDGITFGRCCLVPDAILPAAVNQHVCIIRVDPNKCLPGYLLAYLCLSQVKEYIANFNAGGSRRAITKGHIESFIVPIAPLHTQERIQRVTFSLIEKIELNTQTNQTLEAIAQAIFKSWFVDFDPVKAKIAVLAEGGSREQAELAAMSAISGKSATELAHLQHQNPAHYQQLAQTAALFPSAMVDAAQGSANAASAGSAGAASDLGEIPEGWELSEIGNEVDIVGGGTPSTAEPAFWEDGEIHWTTPKDLSNNKTKVLLNTERRITEAGLAKISSGLLPINTVLMSSRAPVGYLAMAKIPVAINQGYIAMKCNSALSPEFIILWAESVMDEIQQRATGTTFAEISKKVFRTIPVIKPSKGVVEKFTEKVKPMFSQIASLELQNQTLIQLRDSLLPRLLSGEITLDAN